MVVKVINWMSVAIVATAALAGGCPFSRSRQKADMTGGRYIVYRIDDSNLKPEELNELTKKTIEVLEKRVDRDNVLKLGWINRGSGTFEVQIPIPDESVKRKHEAYRESVTQLDKLNIKEDEAWRYYLREEIPKEMKKDRGKNGALKKYFKALDRYSPYSIAYDPVTNRYHPEYVKARITQAGRLDFRILPTLDHPDSNKMGIEGRIELLESEGPAEASDKDYVWCEINDHTEWKIPNSIVGSYQEKQYVLASNAPDKCMLSGPKASWKVQQASRTIDQMGRCAVSLTFDENGGKELAALTGKNIARPLCILLDDVAINAPNISSRIYRDVIITGNFSMEEQTDIVHILGGGVLSVNIFDTPVSEGIIGNEGEGDEGDLSGDSNS